MAHCPASIINKCHIIFTEVVFTRFILRFFNVLGNGTSSVIRGHWNHKHYTGHIIRSNVIDFEINDGYMFQTQKVRLSQRRPNEIPVV
jgi:hypothetical protein